MKQIVLAGATGLVGSCCLRILLDSPDIQKVIVLTRRSLGQLHPKLEEHLVDFSKLDSLVLPKIRVDAVFCCLGTTIKQAGSQAEFEKVDLEYVVALAKWGIRHHAKQFSVISSMGADANSSIFYNRVKGRMEAEISKSAFPSISIFRPSLLLGKRQKPRLGEKLGEKVMMALNPMMQGPLRKYRAISAENVAKAMVKDLEVTHQGRRIYLSDEIARLGSDL